MLALLLAATLPVIACPTTDGLEDQAEKAALPATMEVDAGPGMAVYLPGFGGSFFVVAPRGWSCTASIGADGSMVVDARGSGRERIRLVEVPGCLVCRLGMACPYFRAAAADLRENFPDIACKKPRKGMRQAAPDLFRSRSAFILNTDRTIEAACTLGARCPRLLDAMLASARQAPPP